jgi:hypothetical protein
LNELSAGWSCEASRQVPGNPESEYSILVKSGSPMACSLASIRLAIQDRATEY